MQQVLRGVAGLALMAALFWVVLRGHDPHAVAEALLRASIVGVAAGATLNFAHNIFRTWRWGALLAPAKPEVPFRPMFAAIVIGYLVSWIVPARLGEVVRPALLATKEKVPMGACLGSVVADRLPPLACLLPPEDLAASESQIKRKSAGFRKSNTWHGY